MKFKSSPSRIVVTITVMGSLIVSFLILGLTSVVYKSFHAADFIKMVSAGSLILFFAILYFISYSLSPREISVGKEGVVVHCRLYKKMIPLTQIVALEKYETVTQDVRHFGSNGVWGYVGVLEGKAGRYYSYSNNALDSILIKTQGGKQYLISSDNTLELQKLISLHVPIA